MSDRERKSILFNVPFENVRDYFTLVANLLADVLEKKSVAVWQRSTEIRRMVRLSRGHISPKLIVGCPRILLLNQLFSGVSIYKIISKSMFALSIISSFEYSRTRQFSFLNVINLLYSPINLQLRSFIIAVVILVHAFNKFFFCCFYGDMVLYLEVETRGKFEGN